MYNDLTILKINLAQDLENKFGENIKNSVFSLLDFLTGKDTFVDKNLLINLQNILPLNLLEADYFINLSHELAKTSVFAPVLLLEKIPTLCFYGLTEEVGKFLLNIRNYGARALSLFLGSDQLKTEDLIDVLELSDIAYYKVLLEAVNQKHSELGLACSFVMRYSVQISRAIAKKNINNYLTLCSILTKKYNSSLIEQFIRNSAEILRFVALDQVCETLEYWYEKAPLAAEFIVTHPAISFSSLKADKILTHLDNLNDIRSVKIAILRDENYKSALEEQLALFTDPEFAAILHIWPTATMPLKANILSQLKKQSYKQAILSHPATQEAIKQINQVTRSSWFKSWTFCEEVIDLHFIRKRLRYLLQHRVYFSLEAKTIIKKHASLFDRANTRYNETRVTNMIHVLLQFCVNDAAKNELCCMLDFISGNRFSLKNLLSQENLVIEAWERDPWVDYGKSDELYSCTGLGDYNAGNAPAFLADFNLNNLDIWSGGVKVGRIHLCLIKDEMNKPLLLLDCVDGSERIIASKKKFTSIMRAIFAYTKMLGIAKIKINYDIDYNMTPKKFIAYVEKMLGGQDQISFFSRFLPISTTRELLPFPCQTFLESFIKNNGGFIRGALVLQSENAEVSLNEELRCAS